MKSRRVQLALFVLLAVVSLLAASPAVAQDSHARIVRLSYIEGTVQIDRNIGQGFEIAVLNMPITQGTRLRTSDDARAEVEFENGSVMRITGAGSVMFRELSLNPSGGKVSFVDVPEGTVFFDIKHKGDDDFRVMLDARNLRIRHDAHFRVDITTRQVYVAVFNGELNVDGPRELTVKKNETLTLDLDDAERYYLARGIDSSAYDQWDSAREDYLQQYARSQQRDVNNYYDSGYSYGWSDLNYYGSYFNAPGYGWLWRPAGYGIGWDPFANGAWSWYPGSGWAFVSTYPWGWTPYRYGSWVFVSNRGWCWRPSNNWNRWNSGPVIVHRPHNFDTPTPPRVTRPGGNVPGTVLVGDSQHSPLPGGPQALPGVRSGGTVVQHQRPDNNDRAMPAGARGAPANGMMQSASPNTGIRVQNGGQIPAGSITVQHTDKVPPPRPSVPAVTMPAQPTVTDRTNRDLPARGGIPREPAVVPMTPRTTPVPPRDIERSVVTPRSSAPVSAAPPPTSVPSTPHVSSPVTAPPPPPSPGTSSGPAPKGMVSSSGSHRSSAPPPMHSSSGSHMSSGGGGGHVSAGGSAHSGGGGHTGGGRSK